MDSEKIILTKELFRVLSSETRITILKKLAQRRMTISELSRELKIAKSTVHEHLALMSGAGLIVSVPDEHEWKYYEITRNGENLLAPENSIPIAILLTTTGLFFLAGSITAFVVAWLSMTPPPVSTPIHGGGYPGYLYPDLLSTSIGILFLIAGILVFIRLFKIRTSFKTESQQSS
ncbi:MAG: winged helix-turn-helix domain-containing protein [Methanoregula sp.]